MVMPDEVIYLDNHATTRVDPRVVEAMSPYFTEIYGNAGSVSHAYGQAAKEAVDQARATIAAAIGAGERDIVFTSGATESVNLAIRGVAERQRRKGNHIISLTTEHRAVLDPLAKLARRGYEVTLVPVVPNGGGNAALVDLDRLSEALREETILVSVMLANNEVGVIQPIADIGRLCRERGITFHCDATQAVGKLPVDVNALGVHLMSFTAHKMYGPKGVGALYVRRRDMLSRLEPQIDGGGQEWGMRSGTLNTHGIVGFATALRLCMEELPSEGPRLAALRDRLYQKLKRAVGDLVLNGPTLDRSLRLDGNLNVSFPLVDGEALMMSMRRIAVSSGSACTSANPEPSHVLRALNIDEDLTRASLRFGLGRFNTPADIEIAVAAVAETVARLRKLSGMA